MRSRLISALNKFHKEERGFALPFVFILLLVGVILMPQIAGMVGVGVVSGSMYDEKSEELYAADAGATDAMWLLAQHTQEEMEILIQSEEDGDPQKYIYELPETVNDKAVYYEIMVDGDEGYIIESTATAPDGSSTTIEVWCIHPEDHPNVKFSTGSLDGELRIAADMGTELEPVNIYADGNIKIQSASTVVWGNAYYTPGHTIDVDKGAFFSGETIETRPLQMEDGYLPDITDDTLWTLWDDDYTVSGTQILGWMHITGKLTIGGGATLILTGPIWVDGQISATASNITIQGENPGDYEFLISDYPIGTGISIQGGTIEAILYTCGSDIYLAGNVDLHGAAVGYGDIDIMGTASLLNAVPLKQVPISFYPMGVLMWKIY